jgi:PAS domain S-box-containing protein
MALTLRFRIFLTLLPLLVLLAAIGTAGVVLLYRLGGSIDLILRENYASVIAMERLNEALERIDSSFQFAIAGEEEKARDQYARSWPAYRDALDTEQNNITLPGEAALVEELTRLTDDYQRLGEAFYAPALGAASHRDLYFRKTAPAGLLHIFEEIKRVSGEILRINQQNMQDASEESRELANRSLAGFAIGLAVCVVLAVALAYRTLRTILQPIQAVTQSALAIGAGNLDQVVPVTSRDELGQLAHAFNTMGRQLRQYRQTDYARLLRAQHTSQATIDSFPDPILVVDSERRVEMANPAARRLLGVRPRPLDGEAGPPWQPPESLREPLEEALRRQLDYRPEGFDQAVSLSLDGRASFFLPRILPIRDRTDHTLGAAVLLQDVTRFQLLDQVKSNLVATVSHELKTPLTSIRLVVHLLLEEAAGTLTPKQTELLLDARENTERLHSTINNLLDLTRLESGQGLLDLQRMSPAPLLQAAATTVRPRALDKEIELTVEAADDLPWVAVDVARFGHALDNLLDNAVAYTPPGGRITLSAAADGRDVILSVADTGPGIPFEHLPHVFERFFRVPGHSRGGGTGLGLAIVREIVVAHDGTIRCEQAPGGGTLFRITLPIAEGGRAAGKDDGDSSGRSSGVQG